MPDPCSTEKILKALNQLDKAREFQNKRLARIANDPNFVPSEPIHPLQEGMNNFNKVFNANAGFDVSDAAYLRSRDEYYVSKKDNPFNDNYLKAEAALVPTNINGDAFNTRGLADLVDQFLVVKGKLSGIKQGHEWSKGLDEAGLSDIANNLESAINQSPETRALLDTHYQTQQEVADWAKKYGIDYQPDPDALPNSVVQYLESTKDLSPSTFANVRELFKQQNAKVWSAIQKHNLLEKVIFDFGQPYVEGMDMTGLRKVKARPGDVITTALAQERPVDTLYRLNRNNIEDYHPDINDSHYVIPEKYAKDIDIHTAEHSESPVWSVFKNIAGGGTFFRKQVTGSSSNISFFAFVGRQLTQDFTNIGNHPQALNSLKDVTVPLWKFFVQGNEMAEIIVRDNQGHKISVPVKELVKGGITDNMSVDSQGKAIEMLALNSRIKTGKGFIDMALGIPGVKHGIIGLNTMMQHPLKINQVREAMTRAASAIQFIKEGKTLPEAHYLSGQRILNTESLTPIERRDIAGALSPFYSVLKSVLVNNAKSAVGMNGKAAMVGFYTFGVAIPAAISTYNQAFFPETYEKLKKTTPNGVDYIILGVDEDGQAWTLPYLTSQSLVLGLTGLGGLGDSLGIYLAEGMKTGNWEEAYEKGMDTFIDDLTNKDGSGLLSGIPVLGSMEETAKGLVSPGIKTVSGLLSGHNPDTGAPLFSEDDNLGDRAWKTGKYVAGTFAPNLSKGTKLGEALASEDPQNVKATSFIDKLLGARKDSNSSAIQYLMSKEEQEKTKLGHSQELKDFAQDVRTSNRQEVRALRGMGEYRKLNTTQQIKVQSLIKSGEDTTGINKNSLMKEAKELEQEYDLFKKGQSEYSLEELNQWKADINSDWETWKQEADLRAKIAIDAVREYEDPKDQRDAYKDWYSQESALGTEQETQKNSNLFNLFNFGDSQE